MSEILLAIASVMIAWNISIHGFGIFYPDYGRKTKAPWIFYPTFNSWRKYEFFWTLWHSAEFGFFWAAYLVKP